MSFKILEELFELTLVVACLYVALGMYVRRKLPTWSVPLERRRLVILWVLVLVVLAIKVTEDVIGGESGPIDRAILTLIRGHVPNAMTSVFQAITLTGSASVLIPVTLVATIALLVGRRRFEALLLVASTISAAGVVYVVKTLVGRAPPDLWPAQWYWGSSFPSGHTLVIAAFATAGALILPRIWPATREWAVIVAFLWILLVAFSRLVLGVHWPTDVLAASCIGATLPLVLSLVFDFSRR
jgi:undecaprenyl-diphosphatase